jgi:hypothetical protein
MSEMFSHVAYWTATLSPSPWVFGVVVPFVKNAPYSVGFAADGYSLRYGETARSPESCEFRPGVSNGNCSPR